MSNSVFDQLNLRPQEKRVIFVIGVIVFVVLYVVMVMPHFSDWGRIKKELEKARTTYRDETNELGRDTEVTNGYRKQLAKLEREQKGGVSQYDQSLQLQKAVNAQAPRCGVDIFTSVPGAPQQNTNQFFDEQTLQLSFEAGESNLVNFLYNIGNDPSMVRIRELHLLPAEAGRYKLKGTILLSANFEKRPVVAAPETKGPVKSGAKPAAAGASAAKGQPGAPGALPGKGPAKTPFPAVGDRKKL